MIKELLAFDGFISIDSKTLNIKEAHLQEPFDFILINSLEDLSEFFKILFGADNCPLIKEFEYKNKSYIIKQKKINNEIIFFIQNIDEIKKILFDDEEVLLDGLTKCYLKKEIKAFIENALENFIRYKKDKFSIIMFDIDFFKKVNDTYGHLAGDYILKELAKIIKSSLRKADICGRFGGEEFLILLTHTKASDALKLAKKLNTIVKKHHFEYEKQIIPIKISLGITSVSYSDSYYSILQRCDEALYNAKENGRDRVEYK